MLDRAFHQRPAFRHLDGVRLAARLDIGDAVFLRHYARPSWFDGLTMRNESTSLTGQTSS